VPGFTKAVRARGRLAQAIGSFAMNFAYLKNRSITQLAYFFEFQQHLWWSY